MKTPATSALVRRLVLLPLLLLLFSCEKPYEGYSIGDIHLDLSSQEVLEMYPARGMKADLKWMRTGDFGVIIVRPEDGSKDREESYTLLENKVLQYTSTEPLDETRFKQLLERLSERHGEPQTDPPQFARHNSYLRGLNSARSDFEEIYFWGDKERSEVLSICYSKSKNKMYSVLFDPQRYNRIDQMTREQNDRRRQITEGMQGGAQSEPAPPPADGSAPPADGSAPPPADPPPGG